MSGGTINYYLSKEEPHLLILGSSRAHHHVNPDSLPVPSFNLSHNGMRFEYQIGLADYLSQKNHLPKKMLLIQVEPEELMEEISIEGNDFQFLGMFYDESPFIKNQIDQMSSFEWIKYSFSSYKFNGRVPSIINNWLKTIKTPYRKDNGFYGHEPTKSDSANTSTFLKVEFDFDKFRFTRNSKSGQYLDHLIELCASDNLSLVFFTSPYFKPQKRSGRGYKELVNYLTQNEVKYFDFAANRPHYYDNPWIWKDYAHLNALGAQEFSKLLADSLSLNNLISHRRGY